MAVLSKPPDRKTIRHLRGHVDLYERDICGHKQWIARSWPRTALSKSPLLKKTHNAAKLCAEFYRQINYSNMRHPRLLFSSLQHTFFDFFRALNQSPCFRLQEHPNIYDIRFDYYSPSANLTLLRITSDSNCDFLVDYVNRSLPYIPHQRVRVRRGSRETFCLHASYPFPPLTLEPWFCYESNYKYCYFWLPFYSYFVIATLFCGNEGCEVFFLGPLAPYLLYI